MALKARFRSNVVKLVREAAQKMRRVARYEGAEVVTLECGACGGPVSRSWADSRVPRCLRCGRAW